MHASAPSLQSDAGQANVRQGVKRGKTCLQVIASRLKKQLRDLSQVERWGGEKGDASKLFLPLWWNSVARFADVTRRVERRPSVNEHPSPICLLFQCRSAKQSTPVGPARTWLSSSTWSAVTPA